MGYSNYINGAGGVYNTDYDGCQQAGYQNYNNYANLYYDWAGGPGPTNPSYGYYIGNQPTFDDGNGIGPSSAGSYANSYSNYVNYNDMYGKAPEAWGTAGSTHPSAPASAVNNFNQGDKIIGGTTWADVQNIRQDLVDLSTSKVQADGNVIPAGYTPSFTENVGANFNIGQEIRASMFNELRARTKALWELIMPTTTPNNPVPAAGVAGEWPADDVTEQEVKAENYTQLIDRIQEMANQAQPRHFEAGGYNNCINKPNDYLGTPGYSVASPGPVSYTEGSIGPAGDLDTDHLGPPYN